MSEAVAADAVAADRRRLQRARAGTAWLVDRLRDLDLSPGQADHDELARQAAVAHLRLCRLSPPLDWGTDPVLDGVYQRCRRVGWLAGGDDAVRREALRIAAIVAGIGGGRRG